MQAVAGSLWIAAGEGAGDGPLIADAQGGELQSSDYRMRQGRALGGSPWTAARDGPLTAGVLGLLQQMVRRSLTPDVVSCNVSISACAKGEHWYVAFGLLQEMFRQSLMPDVVNNHASIEN